MSVAGPKGRAACDLATRIRPAATFRSVFATMWLERVLERGAHDELLSARGLSFDMVMRQTESPHATEEVLR